MHYYGGIKNYQWVALPLALHGVIAKKDGSVIEIAIGEDEADPVFCVSDLLPHLGAKQLDKKGKEVVEGEDLDVIVGNRFAAQAEVRFDAETEGDGADSNAESSEKDAVKAFTMKLIEERYGISEEDFLSAELEVVPQALHATLGLIAAWS